MQYKTLITDSDADGVICAAILMRVYPDLEIKFSNPMTIQDGNLNFKVDSETIVSDLPFLEGCGLYFDHHESNEPKTVYNGKWAPEWSAAQVVYDYFKSKANISDFAQILPILNKFDSGNLALKDVEQMDFYLKFIYSTKNYRNAYYKQIIKVLVEKGPEGLKDDEKVASEITKFESDVESMKKDIKNVITSQKPILYVNLVGKEYSGVHITLIEKEFYDHLVFILFKEAEGLIRVTLFDNNLNPKARTANGERYNLLAVAKQMNPKGSGGHRSGCGFTLPVDVTVEKAIEKMTPLIMRQV